MIGFDALVGNQDRHLYNWGVIVHPMGKQAPTFSPIYDTARGLFWNESDRRLARFESEEVLQRYVQAGRPLIGCDKESDVNHFRLVSNIAAHDPLYAEALRGLASTEKMPALESLIDEEFGRLLSVERRKLIVRCLELRLQLLGSAIEEGSTCYRR